MLQLSTLNYKGTPYQNAVAGIANRVRLAKELQSLFKPVREYRCKNHKYRPSPTMQIYNAHHIKIDDTQYWENRENFSRLYQSLRGAYIPHQDMLMMVGNPYIKTIQNWDNISHSRQQVIRSEYPEIPEIAREYERWDSRQNRINEGVEDFSVDILNAYMFVKTFSWNSVKWVTSSAMNLFKSRKVVQTIERNATKLENASNKLLPGEGKVGTYKELQKLNSDYKYTNLARHHMPSAKYMEKHGIKKGDGIAMNVAHPKFKTNTAGRHQQTRTFGGKSKIDSKLEPRDELAADIKDMKRIYKKEGIYTKDIRDGLLNIIKQSEKNFPKLFKKGKK